VIADYQMPEMDGAALAAAIAADLTLECPLFILLTSVSNSRHLRDLEKTGVDVRLVKPVRHSKLMETLATVWSAKRTGKTRGAPCAGQRFRPTLCPVRWSLSTTGSIQDLGTAVGAF
jgi:response regulator RpfG family c-di-GMP phosphodiesterase